jgi:biopolymer transport protein ExbD
MARKRMSNPAAQDEDTELNMTPMLDVVFILLIFFIVTAVFVKEPGIDPIRPDVAGESTKPVIIIAVSDESTVFVDKREYEIAELRPVLEELRAENPKGEAIIQGDEDAKFSTVYEVQEILTEIGIPAQYVSVRND